MNTTKNRIPNYEIARCNTIVKLFTENKIISVSYWEKCFTNKEDFINHRKKILKF